jgi:glycyl-tRNA synthetase beta chain
MVMADDPAVRANRLALLAALQRLFQHTANLSRLPGLKSVDSGCL